MSRVIKSESVMKEDSEEVQFDEAGFVLPNFPAISANDAVSNIKSRWVIYLIVIF
jgi:hypothetical protein